MLIFISGRQWEIGVPTKRTGCLAMRIRIYGREDALNQVPSTRGVDMILARPFKAGKEQQVVLVA